MLGAVIRPCAYPPARASITAKLAGSFPFAPINLIVPTITGTVSSGQTLTASTGTWASVPPATYAYQWYRNGAAISGATASAFVVTASEVETYVTVTVTATNVVGSASATSGLFLGTLPGVTSAYSMRRLSQSYSGPLARVRREGPSPAELDIGFTASGVIDWVAIAAFCGGNAGWWVNWYDQSGNNRHLTNASGSVQFNAFFSGSSYGGLQGANGVTRFMQTANDAAFNVTSSPMTHYLGANTSVLGGTSFGRMYNLGSAGGGRIMMATQSVNGPTPRLLVQRPSGGVEWYSTPSGDVANGESVIVTDKTSAADISSMRSWINGGSALAWGPTRTISAMDGSLLLGAASNDTGTGYIYKEFIVCNQQHSAEVRNRTTSSIGAFIGATIT